MNKISSSQDQLQTALCALSLDMDIYLDELKNWNTPEDEKQAFVRAMWNLLINFAEIGFRIHPVQLATMLRDMSTGISTKAPENRGLQAIS